MEGVILELINEGPVVKCQDGGVSPVAVNGQPMAEPLP